MSLRKGDCALSCAEWLLAIGHKLCGEGHIALSAAEALVMPFGLHSTLVFSQDWLFDNWSSDQTMSGEVWGVNLVATDTNDGGGLASPARTGATEQGVA